MYNRVHWAEVNLDHIAYNTRQVKALIGERCEIAAVIKANAYGHGALPVARVVLANGASRLAVAWANEGFALRQAGITAPILAMGYEPPGMAPEIVAHSITPAVADLGLAQALSAAVALAGVEPVPVHIKVDTGMGRFGLLPEDVVPFARAVSQIPGLRIEGLFTHYSSADEADLNYTYRQLSVYQQVLKLVEEAGIAIQVRHGANSAATMAAPETRMDLVRPGIALYGLRPSSEVHNPLTLRPALTLKSRIAQLHVLPAGSAISYNRTYTTTHSTSVGLVPVGYGDGYRRNLSNKGMVLVRGKRVPIIGRICMDQFMVDLTQAEDARAGDEVVLLGRQGADEISAEELGAWAGTSHYETLTALLPRVPRVYLPR
jgi:alanine racemase